MIACRPHSSSPSPSAPSQKAAHSNLAPSRPATAGGPVFLPPRRPSAFARRLVDELQTDTPAAESVTVHGG